MEVKLKVTILLATYNRAHLIEETLNSIQNQTYQNFECLIIDDGSIDNTIDIIQPFLEDSHFTYRRRTSSYKKGLSGCRNLGLDLATGSFIIFFDDDDIIHPQNLECCLDELQSNSYDFCRYQRKVFNGVFTYDFDEHSNYTSFEIKGRRLPDLITNKLPFNSCAVMWRKDCFDENRFIESLQYAEEWELYSRILAAGKKGISINKTLYYARKHPNSNTGEFYSGNKNRMHSKIEASKLIISNLNQKNLLSPELIHFFCWESFRYKNHELFQHLIQQSSLNSLQKIDLKLRYHFSPFIKYWILLKKKWM